MGGNDHVYLTLGSMTDSSSFGSNHIAPEAQDVPGPAWRLWKDLADAQPNLGNPDAFSGDPQRTAWNSFTVTLSHSRFHDFMEDFSGNASGTGGLVTFADSSWLLSIVMFHQPHFRDQPSDRFVFWGYGLRGDRCGDAVKKPLSEVTGDEFLAELSYHLGISMRRSDLLHRRDRYFIPHAFHHQPVHASQTWRSSARSSAGSENFAIIGQYCELEYDCVFTVEYSVRSAWTAVSSLTGKLRPPPPVVRSDQNPLTFLRATCHLLFG